jgi:hypothetical protein
MVSIFEARRNDQNIPGGGVSGQKRSARRKLESSILRMSSAFSSFGAIRVAKFFSVISGFWIRDVETSPVLGRVSPGGGLVVAALYLSR